VREVVEAHVSSFEPGSVRRPAEALVEQGLRRSNGVRASWVYRGRGEPFFGERSCGVDGAEDVSDPFVLDPRGLGGVDHASGDGDEPSGEESLIGLPIPPRSMGTVESPRTRRRTCTVSALRSLVSSKSSGRAAAVKTVSGALPMSAP